MSRSSKRRPDMRMIRDTKSYYLDELSKTLDKSPETVASKIREWGLETDDKTPILVFGWEYKRRAIEEWGKNHTMKCGPFQMLCTVCREPKDTDPESWRIETYPDGRRLAFSTCPEPGCTATLWRGLRPIEKNAGRLVNTVEGFNHLGNESTREGNRGQKSSTPAVSVAKRRTRSVSPPVLPQNMFNERVKRNYFEHLLVDEDRSEKSVRIDEIAILQFEQLFVFRNLGHLTVDEVRQFKKHLEGTGLTPSVVQARLASIRRLHEWLILQKPFRKTIDAYAVSLLRLKRKKSRRLGTVERIVDTPTLNQIDQAAKSMPTERLEERRNRAAFVILAMTAVRISALVSLRLKHLELEKRVIYQPSTEVDTKFAKAQTTLLLDFFPEWIGWVSDYIAELKSLGFGEDDPFLPRMGYPKGTKIGFGGRTMQKEFLKSGQVVWATVRGTFERIGLKPYSPHIFRHVHGKLANHPKSNAAVMKMLSLNKGHSEIRTSASYGTMDLETRQKIRDQFREAIMSGSDNPFSGSLSQLDDAQLLAEVNRRLKKRAYDAGQ